MSNILSVLIIFLSAFCQDVDTGQSPGRLHRHFSCACKFEGWKIFTRMFKKLPTPLVLKFLNEETKLTEDLQIMASVNFWSFTKAAYEEIMGVKKIFSKEKKAQPQIK